MRMQRFGFQIKKAGSAVLETFYRFPLTLIILTILAGLMIYQIELSYSRLANMEDTLNRIMAVLALGVPLSLSVHLLHERYLRSWSLWVRVSIFVITLGLLFLYYIFYLPGMDRIAGTRLMLVTSAAGLLFLSIPYMLNKPNFEVYIAKLLTRAVTSAFFTLVLALGLSATLFAVQSLLYADLSTNLFSYIWVLTWFLFAPVHFLYDLPLVGQDLEKTQYNKVIKIMMLYIVLPIITIYTVVLYLYFMKILLSQVWPIGMVSYLVVSYAAVGTIALFMIRPFLEENKWAKVFTTAYTKLVLPLLLMMFVSIGIRIANYGLTENRYFIVVIGLWSLFAVVFILLNKGRHNSVLPISLAIIAVMTVVGPVNAFTTSRWSQNQRFVEILQRNDLIENGRIVSRGNQVDGEDQREISEVLHYFDRYHSLEDVRYLPRDFEYTKFEETFGFKRQDPYYGGVTRNYFSYYRGQTAPIAITGYDLFFHLQAYGYARLGVDVFKQEVSGQYGNIEIVMKDDFILTVLKDMQIIFEYDVHKVVQELYDKYGSIMKDNEGLTSELLLSGENDKLRLQLHIQNVSGSVDTDTGIVTIEGLQAEIFIGFIE